MKKCCFMAANIYDEISICFVMCALLLFLPWNLAGFKQHFLCKFFSRMNKMLHTVYSRSNRSIWNHAIPKTKRFPVTYTISFVCLEDIRSHTKCIFNINTFVFDKLKKTSCLIRSTVNFYLQHLCNKA